VPRALHLPRLRSHQIGDGRPGSLRGVAGRACYNLLKDLAFHSAATAGRNSCCDGLSPECPSRCQSTDGVTGRWALVTTYEALGNVPPPIVSICDTPGCFAYGSGDGARLTSIEGPTMASLNSTTDAIVGDDLARLSSLPRGRLRAPSRPFCGSALRISGQRGLRRDLLQDV